MRSTRLRRSSSTRLFEEKLLLERDYINKYIAKLPETNEIKRAASILQEFVLRKIRSQEVLNS